LEDREGDVKMHLAGILCMAMQAGPNSLA